MRNINVIIILSRCQGRTLRNLPEPIPELMECQEPPKTPKNPVYPNFGLYDKDELPIVVR